MRSIFLAAAVLTLTAARAGAERYSNQIPFPAPSCRYCENADPAVSLAAWNAVLALKEVGATVYGTPTVTNMSFAIDFSAPADGHFSLTIPERPRQSFVSAIGAAEAMRESIADFLADCRTEDGWRIKCAVTESKVVRVSGGYEYVWFGVMAEKKIPSESDASRTKVEALEKTIQTENRE